MEIGHHTPPVVNAPLVTAVALGVVAYHMRKRHGFAGDWDALGARLEGGRGCPICAACSADEAMEATILHCLRLVERLALGEYFADEGGALMLFGPPRAPMATGFVRLAYWPRSGVYSN
jgi:hypothetical protein